MEVMFYIIAGKFNPSNDDFPVKTLITKDKFADKYAQDCTNLLDQQDIFKIIDKIMSAITNGIERVPPRKPERFSFGELKSRIARVYPALYRECYLIYHLQGSKNTSDDKFNGVDMVVNYKRLAIFDDTRRSVTKREIKKVTSGKVDLEVHSNFTNNCEKLPCGLYVYTDEFIDWVREVCYAN